MKAIAVFQGKLKNSEIRFSQLSSVSPVNVKGTLSGLPTGKHGFHIHEYGDLSGKCCMAAGSHFNPKGHPHGGLNDIKSHAGDLGNVQNGPVGFKTKKFSLFGKNSVIGRSLIIHEGEDDLGRGDYPDSSTTGHAGKRIDCAVIGIRNI